MSPNLIHYIICLIIEICCITFVLIFIQDFLYLNNFPPPIIVAFLIAILIDPLRLLVDKITSKLVKNKYDYQLVLKDTSKGLMTILNIDELAYFIVSTLYSRLKLLNASIMMFDIRKQVYVLKSSVGITNSGTKTAEIDKNAAIIKVLSKHREILNKNNIKFSLTKQEREEIINDMDLLSGEICVPLIISNDILGLLILGNMEDKTLYTKEDIKFLNTIASQIVLAIENISAHERIRKVDRLASIGTLAAGVAHEIKNPLSSVKTFLQLLPGKLKEEIEADFKDKFYKITVSEVDRINKIVEQLLTFAKPPKPMLRFININEVLDNVLLLVKGRIKEKTVKVVKHYEENIHNIKADVEQLKEVMINIISNAIDAVNPKIGQIIITTRNRYNSKIEISITDNGEGIDKENIAKLFTPFFSSKPKGTGLGLAITHSIVEKHKGDIEISSAVGEGTTVLITFPSV